MMQKKVNYQEKILLSQRAESEKREKEKFCQRKRENIAQKRKIHQKLHKEKDLFLENITMQRKSPKWREF